MPYSSKKLFQKTKSWPRQSIKGDEINGKPSIPKEYTKQKALGIDSMMFDLYHLTPEEQEAIGYVEIL